MLKKIDLQVMDNIDTDSEVEIESSIIINEIADSAGIDKDIIENIGIQVSLANILLNNDREEDVNNFVSFVPLKWNNNKNEQLEQIKKVFKSIHKVYCNKEVIAYEVYEPRESAIQIFNKMLDQNKINKWIKLFYSKDNANDCNEISLYKYTGEIQSKEEISLMIRDEFFDYILHSGLEKITQPGFCISRYELSEIEKVPFINELFSIVENLYIIVSKEKMENGGICFNKYLTWDYIK